MDSQFALTQIGFTEYEAKVYLALVREYPANGYQISKLSGVPRSMVYEALGRLHARGAVMETVQDRATLYRPLDPALLLAAHEHNLQQLLGGLRDSLGELYQATQQDSVWTVNQVDSVQGYAHQMISQAQSELFLVLGDEDLRALRSSLQAACERGLVVKALLTGVENLACSESLRHSPSESEAQGLTGTLIVVADGSEVLIGSRQRGQMSGTITRNLNLVLIARQFVWMELFTQRIYGHLGDDLLDRLDPEDRNIFRGNVGEQD